MLGAFFQRTSVLISLVHAKKLLLTHGYQSFYEYINGYFDEASSKNKKNGISSFVKNIKKTEEFKEFSTFLDEYRMASNHPKLKKLVEILTAFFSDPVHKETSKVIIFSQFRNSATEIKNYLDKKAPDYVKSEIFVGQNNGGLS